MNGTIVEVTGLDGLQHEWVCEHLPVRREPRLRVRIRAAVLPLSTEETDTWESLEGERVPIYEEHCYRSWRDGGARYFYAYGIEGVANHAVRRSENGSFEILLTRFDGLWVRTPLRILRMITRGSLLEAEGLLLHSSAVSRGTKGIMFVGPSGAGKTTAAMLMSSDLGAELVSTDRTVLKQDGNAWLAFGGPEAHRLGAGFVASSAKFHHLRDGRLVTRGAAIDPLEAARFASSQKYECTFADLRRIGIGSTDSCVVETLVLLDSSSPKPCIERVETDVVLSHAACYLFHPDPKLRFPLTGAGLSREEAYSRLTGLLEDMTVLRLAWDREHPSSLRELLNELPELA